MKESHIRFKKILFCGIIAFLLIPLMQEKFNLVELKPLNGAITEPLTTNLTFATWFSGVYQEQKNTYLNEKFGFRNFFIRFNNQIKFSFFKKANAFGVAVGKKNFLFEESYINAYYGNDFIGYDNIKQKMKRVKSIQDTLQKLNKNIILIFAAGKGSFYPEYIPESYKTARKTTNYQVSSQLANQLKLSHIDFNKYFLENKNKSPYPLYPQYGIHWSNYGMCLVADSITRYIERIRKIEMPHIYWDKITMKQPYDTDYDIAAGMNLLEQLKSFNMAYPHIHYQSDSAKTKPSVLVVADSFYWGIYNFGISTIFTNDHFWYYNNQIYPESFTSPLNTRDIKLKDEIANHDVFLIMATEATLPDIGWGFIENMYIHFYPKRNKSAVR